MAADITLASGHTIHTEDEYVNITNLTGRLNTFTWIREPELGTFIAGVSPSPTNEPIPPLTALVRPALMPEPPSAEGDITDFVASL